MTDDERQALEAELADRKLKLERRRDQPGFAANVAEIEARIAEIESLLGNQTV